VKKSWRMTLAVALINALPLAANLTLVQAQEGKIVPYVPTPQEVVERMLEMAQAGS